MRVNILGPLDLTDDAGRPVAVSRPLHRAMIAVLALRQGQPSSAAELVAGLWGDEPPKRLHDSLRSCVYGVRRVLPDPGRLCTRQPGYLLRIEPHELDLAEFRVLAGQGRAALDEGEAREAAALLDQALGLWRDPPLADLPAGRDRDRLLDQRAEARDALMDARLALGGHRHVLAELRNAVTADPLREHAWAQLIIALYRCGARAEALAAFGRLRTTLVTGHGIEPGPELKELHRRVLIDDPALMLRTQATALTGLAPWQPPSQLPASVPDFTGRADEIALLLERLDAARQSVTVISGMPGAGKTALAVQVSHRARDGFPGGQLYACLDDGGSPRDPHGVLAELLRGLGVPPADIPAGPFEREALYRTALARAAAPGRRVLVLADGARNAAQVRPLLPGTPDAAVLVTSRARLADLEGSRRVAIGDLPPADAVSLLARVSGRRLSYADAEAAAALSLACGGLALAVRIAGARLADEPNLEIGNLAELLADESRCLDELVVGEMSVRARIEAAVRAAGPGAGQALAALAVAHQPGGPALLAAIAANEQGVAALVSGGLVSVVLSEGAGQRAYRLHPLVRAYARGLLASAPAGLAGSAWGRQLAASWLDWADRRNGTGPRLPGTPSPQRS